MRNSLNRRLMVLVVCVGFAMLAPGAQTQHDKEIDVESFHWGIGLNQILRICVNYPPQRSAEQISLTFAKINTEFNQTILERELRVPVGEFRCVDNTYEELVAAGLEPDSTGRLQFLIAIVNGNSRSSVGGTQSVTVGAVQSIDVSTGKTKTYQIISAGN